MKKNLLKIAFVIYLALLVAPPPILFAANLPSTPINACPPGQVLGSNFNCISPNASGSGLGGVLNKIQGILNGVIPVLVALGVVYLVWGIVQYVIRDGEEAKKKGKDQIIYGIIGLAVIISVWGLVYILTNTFNLGNASAPDSSNLNNLLPK